MIKKFNKSLFIACLIGGVIGWAISEIVYNAFKDNLNNIILTGIYFAIMIFFIALPGIISEWVTNHLSGYAWDGKIISRTFSFLLVCTLLAFFIVGALLQFLYGLGQTKDTKLEADDYMIIIDNSGSTSTTDPLNERFSSVVQFINNLNTSNKVMISIFSDSNEIVLPLTFVDKTLSSQVADIFNNYNSFNGTNIQNALIDTLQQYPISNRKAIAVLFSDGESDVDLTAIADMFNNANVNIYTIGFSMQADVGRELLKSIAFETGGVYYEINEVTDFSAALTEIMNNKVERDLLSYRDASEKNNILYILLRVVFIFIIGMLIGPAFGLIFDSEEIMFSNIPIRIGISLVASIIMEVGLNLGMKDSLIRLLMCVLMSLIYTHYHISDYVDNSAATYTGLSNNTPRNKGVFKTVNRSSEERKAGFKSGSSDIFTVSNSEKSGSVKKKPKFK